MENDRLDLDLGHGAGSVDPPIFLKLRSVCGERSIEPPYTSKIKSSIAVLGIFIVLGVCREKYILILTRGCLMNNVLKENRNI